uniref:F-box protein 27 n=1 Tax=Salvator merianae TaxID=96440 RepID=A0A8D0DSV8_SALMN
MGTPNSRATPSRGLPRKEEAQCLLDLNPLPDELLVLILSWVPARTLVTRCRLVCHKWRDIVDSAMVWRLQWSRDPSQRGILEAVHSYPPREWARLGILQPFGRNLIKNPCGEEHLKHWKIQNRGNGWIVEENKNPIKEAPAQTCFVSSYVWCEKVQLVNLLKEGLWEELLDNYQPDILISDWWGAREDCGCEYEVRVTLLGADKSTIAEFAAKPDPIPQWNDASYQQVSHVFRHYGPGVRYVRFYHKGKDTQFWAGHYGARITNSTVLLKPS